MKLKILSWNIWVTGNVDQTIQFLKESGADIIGLQEIQEDDHNRDITKPLSTLGYEHVFLPVEKTWGGRTWNDGPAIFSKYPIISSGSKILSKNKGRGVVWADIKVQNNILHIFCTHLMHTHQQGSDEQEEQVTNLLKAIPRA